MIVAVDPVVGRSPIQLDVDSGLRGSLAGLAGGRSLVIDYYASVLRGLTVGDLTVRLGDPDPEPRYMELEPLEGVTVLAEKSLLELLAGATLHEAGPPFARHLAISLVRPERWIEFLDHHPGRRG
jgi:hypothetical protein